MAILGIYARPDHPFGYGSRDLKAHGYVVIGVVCDHQRELDHISALLAVRTFEGLGGKQFYSDGYLGEWYGGTFDYLMSFEVDEHTIRTYDHGLRFNSIGDNRYVGLFSSEEVIQWIGDAP